MADVIKDFWVGMPIGIYLLLLVSIGLLIGGFFCPPVGVISSSVLYASALIIGGGWLYYTTAHIPEFIERGAKIRASHGKTSIEIGKEEKDERL